MSEVGIEVFFNEQRAVRRSFVMSCETFSEDVSTLVMLMFESTFPEDFVNIGNLNDFMFVVFEVGPNGIVFRRS